MSELVLRVYSLSLIVPCQEVSENAKHPILIPLSGSRRDHLVPFQLVESSKEQIALTQLCKPKSEPNYVQIRLPPQEKDILLGF